MDWYRYNWASRGIIYLFVCLFAYIRVFQLFGLFYSFGIEKKNNLSVADLFSSVTLVGSTLAPTVFTRDRYQQLMRVLRFDDKANRDKNNPLAPVASVSDNLTNFQSY